MPDALWWLVLGALFLAGGWGLIRPPEMPQESAPAAPGERKRRTAGDILAEREAARQRGAGRGVELPPPALPAVAPEDLE